MAKQTPAEIAADKIATQKILREAGHFRQVAIDTSEGRHHAAMADFKNGNATLRAIEAYKVKRAVTDHAAMDGRDANGRPLQIVATVPASVGVTAESDKAPKGNGKAPKSAETPAQ